MTKITMKTQLIYSTFSDKKLRLKIAMKVINNYFLVDWERIKMDHPAFSVNYSIITLTRKGKPGLKQSY